MSAKAVVAKDAELCAESFGDPTAPTVLLVMGAMASMLWWPEEFCRQLADAGHHVIRYDNRDTGRSTHWPQGAPAYSATDMVDDTIAVLDAFGARRAHLVGMSMGGMIAQRAMLRHPDRFMTLTAISTTPVGIDGLPSMTDAYAEHSASGEQVDWTNLDSIADFMRRDARMIASIRHSHDAHTAAALIERDIARAHSFTSVTNHLSVMDPQNADGRTVADINVPLLVIHGEADPIFPLPHGEALAAAKPGSRLVRIAGGGHELHSADWTEMIEAIAAHTAGPRR